MLKRLLVSLAGLALLAAAAQAETYPARTVTIIVPFPAGGPADIVGRVVADQFARRLGGTFVVENIGGAGGTLGTTRAARAPADGYTLVVGHMGTHAAAPALYPNLAYDPVTDFAPIGLVAELPEVLVTRKGLPPNNLQEFIAYAKANESKLNMAHAGVGSVSYVGCMLLNTLIGIHPTLVPFQGSTPATQALLAGQVDYFCDPIIAQVPHIRGGTLKGLALAASQRHPLLPDLPTGAEQGLPAFNVAPFFAVFAPKGTPQPVVDALVAALDAGLDDATVRKRFNDLGAAVADKNRRGPAPLAALVKSEMARLTPILKAQVKK
ncbi:MAG TPA: tripartite tricarboxylate transporter substrate-binding protein [Xanthobacteraceae bacterium]|nr:tripartite tricarboxylate transporter substrate-binding protein [Xanthobacteraceae bacterium]